MQLLTRLKIKLFSSWWRELNRAFNYSGNHKKKTKKFMLWVLMKMGYLKWSEIVALF